MQASSGQMTGPPVQDLLQDGALAGDWFLDRRTSSIRFKSKALGLPMTGAFCEIGGRGTVSPGGEVAASVRGDGEIRLDAEVPINRADFGLTWNLLGMASMRSTLSIHAVFTRAVSAGPHALSRAREHFCSVRPTQDALT